MAPPNERERAYMRAADIANTLLGRGLPLVGFQEFDAGHALGFCFLLPNGERWAKRFDAKAIGAGGVEAAYLAAAKQAAGAAA
jgi:hypothetical protein